jgi:hypothetical protein
VPLRSFAPLGDDRRGYAVVVGLALPATQRRPRPSMRTLAFPSHIPEVEGFVFQLQTNANPAVRETVHHRLPTHFAYCSTGALLGSAPS